MIILDQVSKRYQHQNKKSWFTAVESISLTIQQGEIFGLMGYSGAGKSTLLRLINLLERPDGGTVTVNGNNLTALNAAELRAARQNIGMVFQQFNLLDNRTVAENTLGHRQQNRLPYFNTLLSRLGGYPVVEQDNMNDFS